MEMHGIPHSTSTELYTIFQEYTECWQKQAQAISSNFKILKSYRGVSWVSRATKQLNCKSTRRLKNFISMEVETHASREPTILLNQMDKIS